LKSKHNIPHHLHKPKPQMVGRRSGVALARQQLRSLSVGIEKGQKKSLALISLTPPPPAGQASPQPLALLVACRSASPPFGRKAARCV